MSLKLVSFILILSGTMVTSGAKKKTSYKHSLATIIQHPHQSLVGSAKKITYHRQNICLIKPDNLMCYASNKAPGNKADVLKIFDLVQVRDDGKSDANIIENQNLKSDGLDADYYQDTGTEDGVIYSKIHYKSQYKSGELDSSEYTDDSNFNNENRAGKQDSTDKIKNGKKYIPKYDPDAWYEDENTDDVPSRNNDTNELSRHIETNDSLGDFSTEVTVRPTQTTTLAGYPFNSESVDNDTKNDDFENDTEEQDENEGKDTKNQDDSADNDDSINSKEVGKGTIVIL